MKINKESKVQAPYIIEDYLDTIERLKLGDICVPKDCHQALFEIVEDQSYFPKCDLKYGVFRNFKCSKCPLFSRCGRDGLTFKRM